MITIHFNSENNITSIDSVGAKVSDSKMPNGFRVIPKWEIPDEYLRASLTLVAEKLLQNPPFKIRDISCESNRLVIKHENRFSADQLLDLFTPPEVRTKLTLSKKGEIREFLRRVDKQELKNSLAELSKLKELSQDHLAALKSQNWSHPIYNNPKVELYALKAFISGEIDRFQFSDILLFLDVTRRNKNCQKMQIFSSPSVRDEKAVAVLKLAFNNNLTDAELETFLTRLSQLPSQNTQIYSFPTETRSNILGALPKEFQHLIYQANGKEYQVVLAPRLIDLFLEIKFGKQAMKSNPVLGGSVAAENFKNPDYRDVLIPCSLFPKSIPDKADGWPASGIQFYHHDAAYHLVVESANPHRKAWIELAQIFAPKNNERSSYIYKKLLDREFTVYLEEWGKPNIDKKKIFQKTFFQIMMNLNAHYTYGQGTLSGNEFRKQIASYIAETNWGKTHGLEGV